jgi:hypothetical protein
MSDLESHVSALQREKAGLNSTIDKMNERHQQELELLAGKVRASPTSPSDVRSVDLLATLNREHASSVKRLNEVNALLRNEAADHLATKGRLIEQEKVNRELIRKYSDIETDHTCLLKTVGELFACSPPITNIVTNLSRAARRLQQFEAMRTRLADRERELSEAKLQPAQLKHQLNETNSWLEIERMRNHLLETKAKNQAGSAHAQEGMMIECLVHFLNAIVHNTDDLTIKSAASALIAKADSEEFRGSQTWTTFGITIVRSTSHVRTRMRELERRMLQIFRQITERLTRSEDRFAGLTAKIRFNLAKRTHKKSMIPKPGTLYERSLKPRKENVPEESPAASRTPLGSAGGRLNAQALPKRVIPVVPRRSTPSGIEPPPLTSFG